MFCGIAIATSTRLTYFVLAPRRGNLLIKRRFFNSPNRTLSAELFEVGSGKELLTALENVSLVGMDAKGMVIEGTQTAYASATQKVKKEHFEQRWLCKCRGYLWCWMPRSS